VAEKFTNLPQVFHAVVDIVPSYHPIYIRHDNSESSPRPIGLNYLVRLNPLAPNATIVALVLKHESYFM